MDSPSPLETPRPHCASEGEKIRWAISWADLRRDKNKSSGTKLTQNPIWYLFFLILSGISFSYKMVSPAFITTKLTASEQDLVKERSRSSGEVNSRKGTYSAWTAFALILTALAALTNLRALMPMLKSPLCQPMTLTPTVEVSLAICLWKLWGWNDGNYVYASIVETSYSHRYQFSHPFETNL